MSTEVPYNPYAADGGSPNQETPPLELVIMRAIDAALLDVHTCIPAMVVKIRSTSQVDAQPLLQRKYVLGNQVISIPAIQNVPVSVPRGTNYYQKMPIAVGDLGMVMFSERSLDKYKASSGDFVDPADSRMFHISDAIFVPGLYPNTNPTPGAQNTDMVFGNGTAQLILQQAGKFKLTNGTYELFAQLVTAFQTLAAASTVAGGPFTPDVVAALNSVVTALQALEGS